MRIKFDHILQFKVTLRGVRPPIWRRIQVPCDYSFWDLHVAIQDAMGWQDSHLHVFELPEPPAPDCMGIGIPFDEAVEGELEVIPGWEVPIAVFFTLLARKAEYLYDFGDEWRHDVLLEKILPRDKKAEYPVCIGGRRTCPPEDCGGPPGYSTLLDAIVDPEHEEHEELLEWLGGSFDSEGFDARAVSFDDPHERWNDAFKRG